MSFDVVVAADLDWGIGKSNGLPWPKLAGDLTHFRTLTCAASPDRQNAVVMGRKTWESAEVRGRPLPKRTNIVVTRGTIELPPGVLAAGSLDMALGLAREAETTFVVGGAVLFREAFGHKALRWVYLTRVLGRFACDVSIPNIKALGFAIVNWDGAREGEDNGIRYEIARYAKR